MSIRNWVAKNMNRTNNGGGVHKSNENKRQRWLDEQHARQVDEWEEELVIDQNKD